MGIKNQNWKNAAIIFFTGLLAAVLLYFEFAPSGIPFHKGEQVRLTRSGKYLATNSNGPAWMEGAGWWRFTVAGNAGGGWVKLQHIDPDYIRYAQAANLSEGWMTGDQYQETYHKAEIEALAKKEAAAAAKIHIPTAQQLKAEALAAKEHVVPAAHMVALINKINRTFVFFQEPQLLQGCHRKNNHNYICSLASPYGGGYAWVQGYNSVTLFLSKSAFTTLGLSEIVTPLAAAFMPTAPESVFTDKARSIVRKWLGSSNYNLGLYPYYGSIGVKQRPQGGTRIIADGSPLRPWIGTGYTSSYQSYLQSR